MPPYSKCSTLVIVYTVGYAYARQINRQAKHFTADMIACSCGVSYTLDFKEEVTKYLHELNFIIAAK